MRDDFREEMEALEGQYKDMMDKLRREREQEIKEALKQQTSGSSDYSEHTEKIAKVQQELARTKKDRDLWEKQAELWQAEAARWELLVEQTRASERSEPKTDDSRPPHDQSSTSSPPSNSLALPRWASSPPILTVLPFATWVDMDVDTISDKALARASSPVMSVTASTLTLSTRSERSSTRPEGIASESAPLPEGIATEAALLEALLPKGIAIEAAHLEANLSNARDEEETRGSRARTWVG
ncbi:hypothetical protein CF327_g731 [Tilletia walkeri]|nr:hypothetical protein CF327_g731 [Tilletia walkeri]